MGFFVSSSSTCGPQLVLGEKFFFGSLAFVADDSAWLADAPLQAQLLPSRGSMHFQADGSGALRLQLPACPQLYGLFAARRRGRAAHAFLIGTSPSRCSRWQSSTRWSQPSKPSMS